MAAPILRAPVATASLADDTPVEPLSGPALDEAVGALAALLAGRRVAILTGAGCSTESGIPDYRGPETARRARNPMQGREFVESVPARRRYWARSFLGWPKVASARPNRGHRALAALERGGHVVGVITQNVDGLHRAAGSRRVVELHGALADVQCLACGEVSARARMQSRLAEANPRFAARPVEHAPDGDIDLEAAACERFVVPDCEACGGVLKPRVVFFGENVPRPVVERAWGLLDDADALLVVGSSLVVYSGFRFVRRAAERGLPIALVNLGRTRGDPLATLRIPGRVGEVLPAVALAITARARGTIG